MANTGFELTPLSESKAAHLERAHALSHLCYGTSIMGTYYQAYDGGGEPFMLYLYRRPEGGFAPGDPDDIFKSRTRISFFIDRLLDLGPDDFTAFYSEGAFSTKNFVRLAKALLANADLEVEPYGTLGDLVRAYFPREDYWTGTTLDEIAASLEQGE